MRRIAILPAELINRIAAGECVERPASVVKELVENSIDAGAGRIDVTVHDGGRALIEVVDDGQGMDADDLRLCVQPHATSKIRSDEDLFHIHSMGFRGEALPSIGSVARLQITSRPRQGCEGQSAAEVGHSIRVEGGVVGRIEPVGAPPGTRVEVRDLFYNVPARRKFLKTNQTEMGHITEQFARLALAHPEIVFSLRNERRRTHNLAATADRRKRIGDFYGAELAEVLMPIERAGRGIHIAGWVAPPAESRGSSKWEYTFVNGRYVRDRFVSHAIKAAYRSLIDPSRYPVTFLFITIEPDQIDVNVHPTKIEVRWRDSNYVHSQVLAALREKFLSTNLDRTLRTSAADDDDYKTRVRQAMVDFLRSPHAADADSDRALPPRTPASAIHPGQGRSADQLRHTSDTPRDILHAPSAAGGQPEAPTEPAPTAPTMPQPTTTPQPADVPDEPTAAEPGPPAAMQIHNMYIVAETADGLMIIDQHALHERILYEEYKQRIAERRLESQRLLLPEMVSVPPDRIEVLETHADLLERLGIELTPAGPQSVALHAFPSLLERADRRRFVRDLLDTLAETGARPDPEMLLHRVLDMMACKAAVKFGDRLTHAEVEALLARRELADRSSNCPHGRPTTLHLTLRDLERQFKRR